jgi:ribosomal protein L3 glutamine methyltransferase
MAHGPPNRNAQPTGLFCPSAGTTNQLRCSIQSMPRPNTDAIDSLHTVRDWLRFGTSTFTHAKLVYGHGTTTALDEAAFLTLMALDLPVDQLEPWLDARLTHAERTKIADLFTRRITTRKPAAYLVNAAFIQGQRFYVDERVIVPRSYIGELLADPDFATTMALGEPRHVLELCTGSGCLAVMLARAFPDAKIDATDISADALAVAARNVADYRLGERITLLRSDLFGGLPAPRRYDLIIANPPYVAAAEVAAFDPEYRAEPQIAHLGGADGLDLVHVILAGAAARLETCGHLIVEIGTGQAALEAAYPDLEFQWLTTADSDGEVLLVTKAALARLEPNSGRRR